MGYLLVSDPLAYPKGELPSGLKPLEAMSTSLAALWELPATRLVPGFVVARLRVRTTLRDHRIRSVQLGHPAPIRDSC
jgi:hypothetical protein